MSEAQRARPIVIGVAGGSGSGKSTVVQQILQRVGEDRITYIQHDSYYRDLADFPLSEHAQVNFDHPDALETELLIAHLRQLLDNQPVEAPIYDFTTDTRRPETRRLLPRHIILVEGILIFTDRALRELMDVRIFVDADADLRFIRRLQRDIHERGRTLDSIVNQYLSTVRPMHLEFVEPSKRYANLIIPEGGYNTVALDMIVARIRSMLEGQD